MTSRRSLSIPLALLALILLVPAGAAAAIERTVSVTASATLKVPNDSAGVGFSVSRERKTRGAALRAVAGGLRKVIAAAQSVPGVGEGDVTTGRISVRKTFRGEKAIYRASEGISVVLHKPDEAGALVSAGIAAGASGVSGPNFFVGDTEAAFANALTAAFDKAKGRATALATRAGGTLGQTLTIDEGEGAELIPQFDAKSVAPTSACAVTTGAASPGDVAVKRLTPRCTATPPVKPGTSTVTATVHVVFALQ
jgi:uncharacterized protein YggE